MNVIRRLKFGHVSLLLALFAAFVAYFQMAPIYAETEIASLHPSTVSIAVFLWTIIATWISREFYKGDLMNEKEELKKWNEDWRATVIDYRDENEELRRENDELRETIKELTRENYELKESLEGGGEPEGAIEE